MEGEGLRPILIVIAGPNGSGKTTLTEQVWSDDWVEGCKYVNPDNIARDVFGDWNSPEAILKAANYADAERETCLAERRSLIFETVLSQKNKVEFIARAAAAGYFIRLFFVGTDDPSINAARVAARVYDGGHGVPIDKIIDRYFKSIANCARLARHVDRIYVYDNSIDDSDPRLLFRGSDGRVAKIYGHVSDWALPIIKALSDDDDDDDAPNGPPV
jgi:predicted ABC-type ATPase